MWTLTKCLFVLISKLVLVLCNGNSIEFPTSDGASQQPLNMVSLKQRTYFRTQFAHFCSGTILSKEWVLTAGHCFSNKDGISKERLVVDVGSEDIANGTRYPIEEYFIHPNQSESIQIYKNDLCLVKLEKPINFTGGVQPVHLGTIQDQKEVPILAGGWGRVSQHGSLHKKLRYVRLSTLKYEECTRMHAKRNNLVDRETHICGFAGPGKSLCFGDSGGPMVDIETGYQVGVFSALEDCTGEYPVLFMRLEAYLEWINNVTKLELTLD